MKIKWIGVAAALAALICAQPGLNAQQTPPDNSKVNKTKKTTADQASNSAADRELMQKIRKAMMDDKSLSTYAHNVKLVAKDGKVTLTGPVRSDDEKSTVERLATDAAGAGNVTSHITVKPAATKKKTL